MVFLIGLVAAGTSTLASSADVYVTVDSVTSVDPASVADSVAKASASADLAMALFKVNGKGVREEPSGNVIAGIQSPGVLLTNTGNAGWLYPSAHVTGSYLLETLNQGFSGASRVVAFASLRVRQGTAFADVTQASHTVTKSFDRDGDLTSTGNVFLPDIAAGGDLIVVESSLDGLDMKLFTPPVWVAPNTPVRLWFELRINASSSVGIATADFSNSAQVRLLHDPGVILASDATVPLGWVTAVPEPGSAWLLAGGFGLLGLRYCRAKVRTRSI